MFKKILVPLDGSELAEAVFPQVRALAEEAGGEIALLRVPVYPILDIPASNPDLISALYDEIDDAVLAYLARTAARLREGGLTVTAELRTGFVADTILAYAESIGADLIAMSTHGRSGLARWLIGSVAERVVQGARVPVLVIRPKPGSSV